MGFAMHQAGNVKGTGEETGEVGEDKGELELEGISEGDAVGMKEMETSGSGENWRRCLRWDSD